jgi:nicotinate-nucleotide adenylyltransferase
MRIGLLGGTFNPIHFGHLHIAEGVLSSCSLDQVWFVPAFYPPHKELADAVTFEHRLAMVEAALEGHEHFCACDIEGRRGGISYSVDTLRQLRRDYPSHEFYFIMGLDSFREISSWKDYPALFDLAHIVVAARPGYVGTLRELLPVAIADRFCYDFDSQKLKGNTGFSVILVSHTNRDISSTEIRKKVAAQEDSRELIPRAVAEYIKLHSLYQ